MVAPDKRPLFDPECGFTLVSWNRKPHGLLTSKPLSAIPNAKPPNLDTKASATTPLLIPNP